MMERATQDLGAEVRPLYRDTAEKRREAATKKCKAIAAKVTSGKNALKEWKREMGEALLELRKEFGERGDGFVDHVEKEVGLPQKTSWRYMKRAGAAEDDPIAVKMTAKADALPHWTHEQRSIHLRERLLKEASEWRPDHRAAMAVELRNLATIIEEMK